jgi:hypothetical protein
VAKGAKGQPEVTDARQTGGGWHKLRPYEIPRKHHLRPVFIAAAGGIGTVVLD